MNATAPKYPVLPTIIMLSIFSFFPPSSSVSFLYQTHFVIIPRNNNHDTWSSVGTSHLGNEG